MVITVRKKTIAASMEDLATSIHRFALLLEGQKEKDAAEELQQIGQDLKKPNLPQEVSKKLILRLLEAYSGDHELDAYTIRRELGSAGWSSSEELYLASVRVLNLANRILKSM